MELRKETGRDVGQGARDLYKDLRTFVSSARRDTGKLAKALARDFERAEKELAAAPRAGSRTTTTRRSQPPDRGQAHELENDVSAALETAAVG